ncbi:MAG TPA: trimethylamine methyltransferase family protein [Terriglobales bacterium]|nr:trimethylamine methyltransferase family protein [Terriglobales bacterium]
MVTPTSDVPAQVTPQLPLLDDHAVGRILDEAFQLLISPGVRVGTDTARQLLAAAGARIESVVAHIPEGLVRRCLECVPREFFLHDRSGAPVVQYGGNRVQFDPGSSCLNILDPETRKPRPARTEDLVRLVQVTEMLPQFAAQSTAVVCNDVPHEIGDFYRLFVVLKHSNKPVVTGAFSGRTLGTMLDLLVADAGSAAELKRKPRAVFDVCPSPPLNWSEFAADNLVQLARAGVPVEMVSMPLAGATAPVTLAGSMVQHAAECLSGITIHQLAYPGAPIVWGGAPAIFDMSTGGTPMGAIETAMLNLGCTQVGKHLGLPTHGYLVASDSNSVDAQAGMESGTSAVLGALAGINMISGAGMLDSLACHSVEKLVIDAEAIASAQRLVEGIRMGAESLATDTFRQTGFSGEFLKLKETRSLFRTEQHFPSSIVERGFANQGCPHDEFQRARQRANELVASYELPNIPAELKTKLDAILEKHTSGVTS